MTPAFNVYIPLDKGALGVFSDAACTTPVVSHDIKLGGNYQLVVNFVSGSSVPTDPGAVAVGSLYLSPTGTSQGGAAAINLNWTNTGTGVYVAQMTMSNTLLKSGLGTLLTKDYNAEISWFTQAAPSLVNTALNYKLTVHNTVVGTPDAPPLAIANPGIFYLDDKFAALQAQGYNAWGDTQSLMVAISNYMTGSTPFYCALVHVGVPASGTFGDAVAGLDGGAFAGGMGRIIFKGLDRLLSVIGDLTLGTLFNIPGPGIANPAWLVFDGVTVGNVSVSPVPFSPPQGGVTALHVDLRDSVLASLTHNGQQPPPDVSTPLTNGTNAWNSADLYLTGRGVCPLVSVTGTNGGNASGSGWVTGGSSGGTTQTSIPLPMNGLGASTNDFLKWNGTNWVHHS